MVLVLTPFSKVLEARPCGPSFVLYSFFVFVSCLLNSRGQKLNRRRLCFAAAAAATAAGGGSWFL